MKIHIHKEQSDEKTSLMQLIGLTKPSKCYEVYAWFEVTNDEMAIIEKSPDLKDKKMFDYIYERLDLSPTVKSMIKPPKAGAKGHRFVAYTSDDFFKLEQTIVDAAKALKSHIEGLKDSSASSTIEI